MFAILPDLELHYAKTYMMYLSSKVKLNKILKLMPWESWKVVSLSSEVYLSISWRFISIFSEILLFLLKGSSVSILYLQVLHSFSSANSVLRIELTMNDLNSMLLIFLGHRGKRGGWGRYLRHACSLLHKITLRKAYVYCPAFVFMMKLLKFRHLQTETSDKLILVLVTNQLHAWI